MEKKKKKKPNQMERQDCQTSSRGLCTKGLRCRVCVCVWTTKDRERKERSNLKQTEKGKRIKGDQTRRRRRSYSVFFFFFFF